MPPPQCPECGRFLATAFVDRIKSEPADCPGCGTELSLADDDGPDGGAATPEDPPPVPPPAATLPEEGAAGADEALDEVAADATGDAGADAATATQADDEPAGDEDAAPVELGDTTESASEQAPEGEDEPGEVSDVPVKVPPPAATVPDDVEPEPETSVRPPDLDTQRDPLAGWDETPAITAPDDEPDPAVIAAGAGAGLLLGLLLGGREHRGLGALLGAALGAVVAYLQGER